jgi:nitrite reductase/ring-hydroxylating ferredoxin subunit
LRSADISSEIDQLRQGVLTWSLTLCRLVTISDREFTPRSGAANSEFIPSNVDTAAPGDYLALEIAGEPVLVIRGHGGELRALSNVCRHRLHPLVADGAGSLPRLTCPYHRWTYRLDGQLASAPCMTDVPGFDRTAVRLPMFRVEQWLGFVFVNLDDDAADCG